MKNINPELESQNKWDRPSFPFLPLCEFINRFLKGAIAHLPDSWKMILPQSHAGKNKLGLLVGTLSFWTCFQKANVSKGKLCLQLCNSPSSRNVYPASFITMPQWIGKNHCSCHLDYLYHDPPRINGGLLCYVIQVPHIITMLPDTVSVTILMGKLSS